MDIPAAISLNKTALLRIVAALFALLDAAQARIPLALHRSIARVLRPAESAVRRLIVTLARISKLKAAPQISRPAPTGLVRAAGECRRRSFPLFDPRQRFGRPRPDPQGPAPRISSLAPGAVRAPLTGASPVRDVSDGLETSANLLARLTALKDALGDLPRQARRLVRALERRRHIPNLKFKMPLRPGRAPGLRKKARLEIDDVLHRCDWLARNVVAPNTS
jgi:hypothetical protein